jgi:monothiol glutaredoxin
MNEVISNLIKNEIEQNDVCLFMKGTPDSPQCGFSMAISNMLRILKVNFKGINCSRK